MTMSYDYYPSLTAPTEWVPGQIVVIRTNGAAARFIQFGQWLRFHGKMRQFAKVNHAVIVTDNQGNIIEARPKATMKGNMSEYAKDEYYVINPGYSSANAAQSIAAAHTFLKGHYGWFTIVGFALQTITGIKFQLSLGDSVVCSGLVAASLWAGGIFFNRNPYYMMPADIAAAFNIDFTKTA